MASTAGVSLDRFWRLTPYGLQIVLEGYRRRVEQQYQMAAWHVCYIIRCWTGKRIRPEQLLPRKRGTIDLRRFRNMDELKAYIEKNQAVD